MMEALTSLTRTFTTTCQDMGYITMLLLCCLHQNLEEESQGLETSQDHVIKESIACRSEPADSDAKTVISFLQIAPADNDKGYDSAPGRNILDSTKGKD